MALSHKTILAWLDSDADSCTLAQLEVLQEALNDAKDRARQREQARSTALAQMQALAKAAGFDSPEALLLASSPAGLPTLQGRRLSVPRKPYFSPLSPDPELVALAHRSPETLPSWCRELFSQGWTADELHWKNHKNALKRRGITPLYDSAVKFKELQAREPRGLQRAKK